MTLTGSCFLLHPIVHGLSDQEVAELDDSRPKWSTWTARLDTDGVAVATDYMSALHPHARRLMWPEAGHSMQGSGTVGEARRQLASSDADFSRMFAGTGVRLTWSDSLVGSTLSLGTSSLRFKVEWVDAVLFPDRVGVLIVRLTWSDGTCVDSLATALRQLRKIEYRRRLSLELAAFKVSPPEGDGCRDTYWTDEIVRMVESLKLGDMGYRTTNDDLRGSLEASWHLAVSAVVAGSNGDEEPGTERVEHWAYALATGHSGDSILDRPSAERLDTIRTSSQLAYFDNWRVQFLYENLVQVAWAPAGNEKYAEMLHHNFEYQHLALLVFALVQRRALDCFMVDIAGLDGTAIENEQEFREVSTEFNRFAVRLYNVNATNTPVGEPLYTLLRDNLQLELMFAAAEADVGRVGQQLAVVSAEREATAARRINAVLEFLAIVATPVGLLFTVFPDSYRDALVVGAWSRLEKLVLLALVVCVPLAIWAWLQRGSRR